MSDLAAILAKRDQAGATSQLGRQLTVVAQIAQIRPVDERYAERIRGILTQAEQGLRAVFAAGRAAHRMGVAA